jgi:hypothetical protein
MAAGHQLEKGCLIYCDWQLGGCAEMGTGKVEFK